MAVLIFDGEVPPGSRQLLRQFRTQTSEARNTGNTRNTETGRWWRHPPVCHQFIMTLCLLLCPLAPGCYTCSLQYSPSDGELDNSSAVSSRHNGLYGAGDLAPEHYYTVDTRLQTDHLFSVMSNIQLFVQVLFRSVICVYLVSSVAF